MICPKHPEYGDGHCPECPCEDVTCQKCCTHEEFDHYVCMDCGYEKDPGEDIDRATDYFDDCD